VERYHTYSKQSYSHSGHEVIDIVVIAAKLRMTFWFIISLAVMTVTRKLYGRRFHNA